MTLAIAVTDSVNFEGMGAFIASDKNMAATSINTTHNSNTCVRIA